MHRYRRAVLIAPARGDQPHAQVEVVGEAPRPRRRPQRQHRRQPHELAVPAQADAPEVPSAPLEHLGVDDELHVLHPRQPTLLAVVDADPDLHGADRGIGKVRPDLLDGLRVEPPVCVHYDDDDLVGVAAGQVAAADQVADPGVERLALALPRLRRLAAEQPDPLAQHAGQDIDGAVVRAVVDDQDAEIVTGDGEQPLQAVEDDLLLVQARHHEHEEEAIAGPRKQLARPFSPFSPFSLGLPGRGQRFAAVARALRALGFPPGRREHSNPVAHADRDQQHGQQGQRRLPVAGQSLCPRPARQACGLGVRPRDADRQRAGPGRDQDRARRGPARDTHECESGGTRDTGPDPGPHVVGPAIGVSAGAPIRLRTGPDMRSRARITCPARDNPMNVSK